MTTQKVPCPEAQFRLIRKDDPDYPQRLLHLPDAPVSLYVKGRLPDPAVKTVAIVGARACSPYGRQCAANFAKVLAEHGVQIVSGLAFGIDTAAHRGALDGGGATFAVLGCGIHMCYPKSNEPLYRRMLSSGGGVLTEYEPDAPALPYHFPIRNRIISALSDAVLIPEARQRSGSLITASYALEQGVQIYAVPGRISDGLSSGTNALIAQGAVPALSPETILLDFGLIGQKKEEMSSPPADPSLSSPERAILAHLTTDPVSLDALCAVTGLPVPTVSEALLLLELKGFLFQSIPGLYSAAYR